MTQLSYAGAGVSIEAGDELVERIKPAAKRTLIPGVLNGIGGFGALFEIGREYRNPVLVSGTDGVGTKLMLAFKLGRHDTVGQDLVAMSVNDILVQGAKSLFFLDYYGCGKLNVDIAERVVKGIAKGCELAGCALIGGETAEMPGMYPEGEYDLAGFAVGVVEKDEIIDGKTIAAGDVVLGLASSGPHSNGFSLIRKVVEVAGADWNMPFDGATLADRAMEPTRIYVKQVLNVLQKVKIKGMAHITGGGLVENIPRVLPETVKCESTRAAGSAPPSLTGCRKRAASPTTKCTASLITASAWPWWSQPKTLKKPRKPSAPKAKRFTASAPSRRALKVKTAASSAKRF